MARVLVAELTWHCYVVELVFSQTMVNSISYVLDDLATLEVSTAWTNIGEFA